MPHYWIKTDQNKAGTIRANDSIEAIRIAEELGHGKVTALDILPYPAHPTWNDPGMPAFCFDPGHCKGRGYCTKARACSE